MRTESEIREKLQQHLVNRGLWGVGEQRGWLDPTEPDEREREKTKAELDAAIFTLRWVLGQDHDELIEAEQRRKTGEAGLRKATGSDINARWCDGCGDNRPLDPERPDEWSTTDADGCLWHYCAICTRRRREGR